MIIKGRIGKVPERHKNSATGKPYYTFRLAENHGRDETRTAVWFDVIAAIPPLEADMLSVGQIVSAEGRLEVQPYLRKRALTGVPVPTTWEGVAKCLHENDALAFALKVFTQKVLPDHFEKAKRHQASESARHAEPDAEAAGSAEKSSTNEVQHPEGAAALGKQEHAVGATGRSAPF